MSRSPIERGAEGSTPHDRDRGMSTLLALVAAITVVTITFAGTMVIVEDAFRETRRGDAERAVAIQASDRLVAAGGPIGTAPNVVDRSALSSLGPAELRAVGASDRFAMAVAVDGERIAAVGDPDTGAVVRRIALVRSSERVERTPTIVGADDPRATLPIRTREVNLTLSPPPNTTVTAVRSANRVVLADSGGLGGTFRIETSPYRTLDLRFETTGTLATGDVEVAYRSTERDRAVIAVTVDDRGRATGGGASV